MFPYPVSAISANRRLRSDLRSWWLGLGVTIRNTVPTGIWPTTPTVPAL